MKYKLISVLTLFFLIAYLYSCKQNQELPVQLNVDKTAFEKLSDYHFFKGDLKKLEPNDRVIFYTLNSTLFTDYAFKSRFYFVPSGKTVPFQDTAVLDLPVGSCIIKNFYYPFDFRDESKGRRILETRLLVHRSSGWEALDYVWNDEQTEAFLDPIGDVKKVNWIHYDGSNREINYLIPNKNQCKSCHWIGEKITPIGPKAPNLNRNSSYAEGEVNQLQKLVNEKILTGFSSASECKKLPSFEDSTYSINERARAYLEVNCGHCHNPLGPAYTSGLWLNYNNNNAQQLGVCKLPVAAGKATGGNLYDIFPGKPAESILMYRMKTNDPSARMPEVGRSIEHVEGVQLIEEWIKEMEGNCP